MNKAILHPEVQNFKRKNLKTDLSKLILKGSNFPGVTIQEIANQISGLQKAKQKLPTWYASEGIVFPPNINLEQTSSEITAKYKASLVFGERLIDITGGFGIDTFFFAEKMNRVMYCEINPELSEIAGHNFEVLGKSNIETFSGDGIEFLSSTEQTFDWIYLDPARRNDYGGKVFLLEQCTPNAPEHLKLFNSKADHILIKTSPLLDLTAGIRELGKVAEIHIVSVNNEVKELLWVMHKRILSKPVIKTVNILKSEIQKFESPFDGNAPEAPLSLSKKYLYEPNPAVMKSGLFAEVSRQTGTFKLHANSHLYTSEGLTDFPGRKFEILQEVPYSKKILKKELGIKRANITTRNFPRSVEEIRKELKLEDGGDHYLFFTTNLKNEKIVLICTKI